MIKSALTYAAVIFYLAACSPSVRYDIDYPMTGSYFYSADGNFFGRIPQGWFSSKEDTLASACVVWLMKDNFSAALTIRELKLDPSFNVKASDGNLKLIAEISAGMHGGTLAVEEYRVNERNYCGYEVGAEDSRKKILLFLSNNRYYECETFLLKKQSSEEELQELFRMQLSVLSTIVS